MKEKANNKPMGVIRLNHLEEIYNMAVKCIHENPNIKVKDLCKTVGTNDCDLRLAFKLKAKKSPKQVIDEYRAKIMGENLCHETTATYHIETHCENAGYSSYPTGLRQMKKHHNVTPSIYRENCPDSDSSQDFCF